MKSVVFLLAVLACVCLGASPRVSEVTFAALSRPRLQQLARAPFDHFHQHITNLTIQRVSGTAGSAVARNYILSQLQGTVFEVELDSFNSSTPEGTRDFHNIVASFNPASKRRIVLAAHYDSKWFPPQASKVFLGATDSAVPCAMLLDIARLLSSQLSSSSPWGLQIIFFDGEEAFHEWSDTDSLYGSRHLAQLWHQSPPDRVANFSLDRIELFLLLDLLGARAPRFVDWFPQQTHLPFQEFSFLWSRLQRQQLLHDQSTLATQMFRENSYYSSIGDDHEPFQRLASVPVLHMIAFPFPTVWHTPADDLTAVHNETSEDLLTLFRCSVASMMNLSAVTSREEL